MSGHSERGQAHAEKHLGTGDYVKIGVILTIITAIEFGAVYVEAIRGILVPLLIILSAVKFFLVAAYFMHLKTDSRLFTGVFVSGLAIAAATVMALTAIFWLALHK